MKIWIEKNNFLTFILSNPIYNPIETTTRFFLIHELTNLHDNRCHVRSL